MEINFSKNQLNEITKYNINKEKSFDNIRINKIKKNSYINININNRNINHENKNKIEENYFFQNVLIYANKNKMKKAKYANNETIKYTIRKNKMGNSMVYFNCIKIINLLLLIDLYSLIFSNPNITLIIKGTGLKNIFGNQTGQSFQKQYYPNVIYINGNKQDIINHSYNFNLTINIVELYWNYTITNCTNMFRRNEYMTEINLFYFDASQVQTMWCMFFYCISLTSVNISNFVTSNLKLMAGMFQNCISLTSIDLSSFDTSKVINMGSMFQNCRSLSSLNLSNFDTSNLGSMEKMFEGCTNLEYLNLKKFNEKKIILKNLGVTVRYLMI